MDDLTRAKQLLVLDNTIAVVRGELELVSTKSGIAPMMGFLEQNIQMQNASVADRVVGKAAAMLFVKAKIKRVFARLISRPALETLTEHGIETEFEQVTEMIKNRAGDGLCPMEQTVLNERDVDAAYIKLKDKIASMKNAKQ